MTRLYFIGFIGLFLACANLTTAQVMPPGFVNERVFHGGQDAVAIIFDPQGRMLVADKNGKILLFQNGSFKVVGTLPVDSSGESGLLGLALDPEFEVNNYIYVYYTLEDGPHNRLSRFKLENDQIQNQEEEILLDFEPMLSTFHNGGHIEFGADGKLFVATGDGTNPPVSQSHTSLLGKILRLNPDGSVPSDNPFYFTNEGIFKSIYAMGFRNPFSFSFNKDGKMFVNDVGSGTWEEINDVKPGFNYGWPLVEGKLANNASSIPPDNYQDPIYAYPHSVGCAITGSTFYSWTKNSLLPKQYDNKYFFSDFCTPRIFMLDLESMEVTTFLEYAQAVYLSFDNAGNLYYVVFPGGNGGELFKLSYAVDTIPRITTHPEDLVHTVGESASFNVKATGLAPLTYQWFKNNDPMSGATHSSLTLEDLDILQNGDSLYCRVMNPYGAVNSDTARLIITTRERPEIHFDDSGSPFYIAGDTVIVRALAVDGFEGDLRTLDWKVDFHHGVHYHPFVNNTVGVDSIGFVIPRIGETASDVWYRIHASVTNSIGLSSAKYIDIHPRVSQVTFDGSPASTVVYVDGTGHPTPYTIAAVAGMIRSISVEEHQFLDGNLYEFQHWNDVLANASVQFEVPVNDSTFLASYKEMPYGTGTGLTGSYFNSSTQTEQTLILTRLDKQLAFDWGNGSPAEGINSDTFSIAWQGYLRAPLDGKYTFTIDTEGGAELSIDGSTLIDDKSDLGQKELTGDIDLKAGQLYPIHLKYIDSTGTASLKLYWSNKTIPSTMVPTFVLYSVDRIEIENLGAEKFSLNENISFRASVTDSLKNIIVTEKYKWMLSYVNGQDTSTIYSGNGNVMEVGISNDLTYSEGAHLLVETLVQENDSIISSIFTRYDPVTYFVTVKCEKFPARVQHGELVFSTPAQLEVIAGTEFKVKPLDSVFISNDTVYVLADDITPVVEVISDTTVRLTYEPLEWDSGDGLMGSYFLAGDELQAMADSIRLDKNVDFRFTNREGSLKVNWEGWIKAPVNGSYTFKVVSTNNARVALSEDIYAVEDGNVILDRNPVTLVQGEYYPISVNFGANGPDGEVRLTWSFNSVPEHLIPQGQLFSANVLAVDEQALIEVYPNPTTGTISIKQAEFEKMNAVSIQTMLGQVLLNEEARYNDDRTITVNLTNFSPGVYIITLSNPAKKIRARIVKL